MQRNPHSYQIATGYRTFYSLSLIYQPITKKRLFFWEKGPLFVKEMLAFYEDPKPHFNTLSTIVRGLEEKGFLAHYTFGNTYQYYPVVSEEDFRKGTLRNVISKYFNNSYLNAVSSLVKEEDISLDELKQLIEEVEQADKKH